MTDKLREALNDLRVARKREKRRKAGQSTGEHEFWGPAGIPGLDGQPDPRVDIPPSELADMYRKVLDQHLGYGAGIMIDQYVSYRLRAFETGQDTNTVLAMIELLAMTGQLMTGDGEPIRPVRHSWIKWAWRFLRYGKEADLIFADQECKSKYEREPYSYYALLIRAKMARIGSAVTVLGVVGIVAANVVAFSVGGDWLRYVLPSIVIPLTLLIAVGEYFHEQFHFHEPRFHLSNPEKRLTVFGNVGEKESEN